MRPPPPSITFLPLGDADLPLLHDWLSRPHVVEWWPGSPTLAEVASEFGPAIAGTVPLQCFIALAGGMPIGFVQSYTPVGWHHEGWWLDEHDTGVRGIDQFLANAEQLGRGLGTAMVSSFLSRLFADPAVTRVQTDPAPENRRAIRCYEKAGFRADREIGTPDGRALLMYCERPTATAVDGSANTSHG
jgi:RimJ/RimL family protein N-acetyltransferase